MSFLNFISSSKIESKHNPKSYNLLHQTRISKTNQSITENSISTMNVKSFLNINLIKLLITKFVELSVTSFVQWVLCKATRPFSELDAFAPFLLSTPQLTVRLIIEDPLQIIWLFKKMSHWSVSFNLIEKVKITFDRTNFDVLLLLYLLDILFTGRSRNLLSFFLLCAKFSLLDRKTLFEIFIIRNGHVLEISIGPVTKNILICELSRVESKRLWSF